MASQTSGLKDIGSLRFLDEDGVALSDKQNVHKIDPRSLDLQMLSLAREEYIQILNGILGEGVTNGLIAQYDTAIANAPPKAKVRTYQRVLKDVVLWNAHVIAAESQRILGESKTMLQQILAAIYVSNVKIMASIRVSGGVSYVSIVIPSCDSFVHRVYIEAARIIYHNPLIMHVETKRATDVFQRSDLLTRIVHTAIKKALRAMLPIKELLEEYLSLDNYKDGMRLDEAPAVLAPPPAPLPAPPPPAPPPAPPLPESEAKRLPFKMRPEDKVVPEVLAGRLADGDKEIKIGRERPPPSEMDDVVDSEYFDDAGGEDGGWPTADDLVDADEDM
ncbi:hypothetical protein KFL_002190335 [Klebsormidium nitens]|uniref:Uncharacterized protein n=1 Tax=Klebsormidium nitens TaxID=105231 RepID=A0A1Y1I7G6_KLENI|nr:hypothetical protein KFL_002190335 [Klebsormidium nitens]|eukprot:GAQ85081.1 hypothetical protein KFL_002190335 [Klebsormidium nitens]